MHFEDINKQKYLFYYTNKKNQRMRVIFDDYLYDQVVEFKKYNEEIGEYCTTTLTWKTIIWHFALIKKYKTSEELLKIMKN